MPLTFAENLLLLALIVLLMWILKPLMKALENKYLRFFLKFFPTRSRDHIRIISTPSRDMNKPEKEDQ